MSGRQAVKAGDVIVLAGKTLKGKNRIREHGNRWLVREVDRSVLSRNLGYLVCPATYVGSEHLTPEYDRPGRIAQRDGYCRWVRPVNDEHFTVSTAPEDRVRHGDPDTAVGGVQPPEATPNPVSPSGSPGF